MRLKLAVIAAVLAVMMAGSAWAGETEVVATINAYGLSASGDGSGNITVTGTKANATTTLDLGDISGLTVDWQADLSGPSTAEGGYSMVYVRGNGTLKINNGTITIPGHNGTNPTKVVNGFGANNGASIEMSGGTITGNDALNRGINVSGGAASLTFTGGTINIPYGLALYAAKGSVLTVSAPSQISGGWVMENVDEATSPANSGKATLYVYSKTTDGVSWIE
jgi:hypothetical protein